MQYPFPQKFCFIEVMIRSVHNMLSIIHLEKLQNILFKNEISIRILMEKNT